MAIKGSPSDWVNRWKAGVSGGQSRYVAGVQGGADWAAAATSPAAVQARNAGLQRAMADGSIEAGIARLGTGTYKNITAAKAANWTNGVNTQQAQANALAGFQKLNGFLQTAEGVLSQYPRGGVEENIQRFSQWARSMHNSAQQARGL